VTQEELRAAPRPERAERGGERREQRAELRMERKDARPPVDTNSDGRISREEWLAVPDRMFERADSNRDGRVTREEATNAWRAGVRGR
jgi:Ca2+-binding EF-hand superfamily protein